MKRISTIFFLLVAFGICMAVIIIPAHAQTPPSPIPLNAPFPGEPTSIPGGRDAFGTYLVSLYKFALILGTFFAVLMIVWGGIQYAASGGNPTAKHNATDRIKNAIYGLILLLAVVLIFRTLNPEILSLRGTANESGRGPLNAPTDLSLTNLGQNRFELVWKDNSDEDSFAVNWSTGLLPGEQWQNLSTTVPENSTKYTFSLPAGAQYVKVVAQRQNPSDPSALERVESAPKQIPASQTASSLPAPAIVQAPYKPDPSFDRYVLIVRDSAINETRYFLEGLRTVQGSQGQGGWEYIPNSEIAPIKPAQGPQTGPIDGIMSFSNGSLYTQIRAVVEGTKDGKIEQARSTPAAIPSSLFGLLPNPSAKPTNVQYQLITIPPAPGVPLPTIVSDIQLVWTDNSGNETGFKIEARSNSYAAPASYLSPPLNPQGWALIFETNTDTQSAQISLLDSPQSGFFGQPGATVELRVVAHRNGSDRVSSQTISIVVPSP